MGQIPSPGRIVTFVNSSGAKKPAIITHVGEPDKENSWVNLRIFEDAPGDLEHVTSVPKTTDPEQKVCWDWPAKV